MQRLTHNVSRSTVELLKQSGNEIICYWGGNPLKSHYTTTYLDLYDLGDYISYHTGNIS